MGFAKKLGLILLGGIICYLVGFGVGKYSGIKKQDNEVNVTDKHTTDTKDTTITETKPDGTKIVTVVKENVVVKEKQILVENKVEKIVKPDWHVAAGMGYDLHEKKPVYEVSVDRRILGNISIGVFAVSNNTVGLHVGLEF